MTKLELANKVAANLEIEKKIAYQVVANVFDSIAESVAAGEKVAINGFGSFSNVEQKERNGYNPKKEAHIVIAAKRKIKFHPSNAFKESVNK